MTGMIRKSLLACVAGTGLFIGAAAHAASDYLLELDGVDGSTRTIEVASWSLGASNPTSVGSTGRAADAMHRPPVLREPLPSNGSIHVVSPRDASSGLPTGRSSCATGAHFPTASLVHRTARWKLTDVSISACGPDGMTLAYATATVVKSKSNITNN